VTLGAHYSRDLAGRRAALEDHDQVEELGGEGEPAGGGLLEGDAALWIEADPRAGRPHPLSGRIGAADPRRGKLPSEEEHWLAFAAAIDKRAFGGGKIEHRGCEPGQGEVGHGPMIATAATGEAIL